MTTIDMTITIVMMLVINTNMKKDGFILYRELSVVSGAFFQATTFFPGLCCKKSHD